ncbi:MAG TPA: hypothetical protein PLL99_04705 [Chitinophagales bacterium]|jgi:hypothetical protein|nr:hypothetical protein [Chitinophagales bacterium]HQG37571.1 hypothetical protein [Chitinophagales bacterium]
MNNPRTQVEAIIHYIEKMDIEMIELILEDDKTYEGLHKEEYIEKLKAYFERYKLKGETKLVAIPGFCDSKGCDNACRGGYSFVGRKSIYSIDLVFEVSNGEVLDICRCFDFCTFDKERNKMLSDMKKWIKKKSK